MTLIGNRQGYAIKESDAGGCDGKFLDEFMLLGVSTTHYRDRFDPAVRAHPGEKAGIPALLQPAGIYSEAVLKAFAFE